MKHVYIFICIFSFLISNAQAQSNNCTGFFYGAEDDGFESFCNSDDPATPFLKSEPTTTQSPATFFANSGDVSLNPVSGEITFTTSTPGVYEIGLTRALCVSGLDSTETDTSFFTVEILEDIEAAEISYALPFCTQEGVDIPVQFGADGIKIGLFEEVNGTGLVIDANTGSINSNLSTIGNHTVQFVVSNACPDTSQVLINILDRPTGDTTVTACDEFEYYGETYTTNGTHEIVLDDAAQNGCDSVLTLNLTINNSNTGVDVQEHCDEYTWIDGITYTESNTTATFTIENGNEFGCDSVVTLNLTINNSSTGVDVRTACDEFTWIDGITYNESNNEATFTLEGENEFGCDSVVTLNLTINNSNTGIDVQELCDSYEWIDGVTYTESNNTATFTLEGENEFGCDSVVTLNLTIKNSNTGVDVVTACDSFEWIDGEVYTASNNTATFTIANGNEFGCDSVVTLNLTINNSNTGVDVVTACDSFEWIDGEVYTASNNTATFTIANGNEFGCDSVVTLNLTINNSNTGVDVVTACDSFEWINGEVYTASNNTATFTIANGNEFGCDSVVTLNLTINNSNTGVDVVTACDSFEWINGETYTSNNNTATFTIENGNEFGCDSTVTLNLTINNSNTGVDVQEHCDEYTWIDGITYTENNNTATFTIENGNQFGCDSTVTLDLTINQSSEGDTAATACDEFTYYGNTYTETGVYPIVLESANQFGCDSTVNLDLTILISEVQTTTVTVCNEYVWEGNTYDETGIYEVRYMSSGQCDSILRLDLTVDPTVGVSAFCKGATVFLNDFGQGTLDPNLINANSTACNEISLSALNDKFTCNDIGEIQTATLIVTDVVTNESRSCKAPITVRDTIKPTGALTGGVIFQLEGQESVIIQPNDLEFNFDDNCPVSNPTVRNAEVLVGDLQDPHPVIVDLFDGDGNSVSVFNDIDVQAGVLEFKAIFDESGTSGTVFGQKGFPFTMQLFAYNPESGTTRFLGDVRLTGNNQPFALPANSELNANEVYIYGALK